MNNNNSIPNIDLAYSYTEEFLKDRKSEIKHLESRLGTFLGFAGVLLHFGISLQSSQPSYLLTKIGVLLTSAFSVLLAAWGLRSKSTGRLVEPSYLMDKECFEKDNLIVKAMIINTHKETSHELDALAKQKQIYLNRAITCLAASALLFAINGILVAFCGE
jgi:hypothetical protein